jgi:HSP20 family protein
MNTVVHKSEYSIYPGNYVPMLNEIEINEEIVKTKQDGIIMPSVNITESGDYYKVEIALPGADREDFLVYAEKNVLSVYVLKHHQKPGDPEKFRLHEFSCNCFERHIELPGDADTEFVSAEYKEGILRIYVPIAPEQSIVQHTRIVVY